MTSRRCNEPTSNGYGCINPVQRGGTVCVAHDPDRQCGAPTKKGTPCRRLRMRGRALCSKH